MTKEELEFKLRDFIGYVLENYAKDDCLYFCNLLIFHIKNKEKVIDCNLSDTYEPYVEEDDYENEED